MLKKVLLILIIAIFVIVLGISFFKNTYEPTTILKTAVKEKDIYDENYILCQRERVTGFEWRLIKNEDREKTDELCNISGASPYDDFSLDHEFVIAGNTFVFYVEEKKMIYSEASDQDEIEYIATGWDVLYPIKHSDFFIFDLFKSSKYITEDDLRKE